MFEELESRVDRAVGAVLGFPSWVKFITSPAGTLRFRLTEFVKRVLKELRPEIEGLEAGFARTVQGLHETAEELEDARVEINDLRAQLAEREKEASAPAREAEPEGTAQDVEEEDEIPNIWTETREEAGLWVPPPFDGPAMTMVADIYREEGEEAAVKAACEELERLIAEGKTRPWGHPAREEEEEEAVEEGDELLPADEKRGNLRERAYEIFEKAREAASVFTKPEVKTDEGRTPTAEYAIGKILPILAKEGEEEARAEAEVVLANLAKHNYTQDRPKRSSAPATKPPTPTTTTTPPTPAEDDDGLNLRPYINVQGNGIGEEFLAKTAEAVNIRGETPISVVFKAEAVMLIQAGYDSLEKMVAEKSTPDVDGWVSLVRTAQEFLDAAAAKEEKKKEEKGEETLARKRERVRKAFPTIELADDDASGLISVGIRRPSDLVGKDLDQIARQMHKALSAGKGEVYARQLLEKLAAKPEPQPTSEPQPEPEKKPEPPVADEATPPDPNPESEEKTENLPVTVITGITASVAHKLGKCGANTVGDLAASMVEDFASVKLSKNQLERWIAVAAEMVKKEAAVDTDALTAKAREALTKGG